MKLTGLLALCVALSWGAAGCQRQAPQRSAASSSVATHHATRQASQRKTPTVRAHQTTQRSTAHPQLPLKAIAQQTMGQLAGQNAVYIQTTGGQTLSWRNRSQKAASDIKLFILATVYRQVTAGTFNLSAPYTLRAADKVGGTGNLQAQPDGTRVTNRDLLRAMMTVSDNTATNIVIRRVGGLSAVNQEIKRLGATQTVLRRKMMDQQALAAGRDNVTSARDLGQLLMKLWQHRLISPTADAAMLKLLAANTNHTKLPRHVPAGRQVYNKTGEFDTYGVENDAAIFAQGKRAVVVVALSQHGRLDQQIPAMNRLGQRVDHVVFAAEK
ncbi:serine hydrolase [Levilactobacillus yiduensis]|uniref:serine hydrolase n=1 Tax=Levilactobacillus yiduensis TaxID=2953880 RepID=UPI000EF32743|nr:serine hydrolase [Levilactobacillus yiduensis]AYM01641.1 serine hydrolase [Levilactobacillus brevis]